MNKLKKALSIILVVLMVLGTLPAGVAATEDVAPKVIGFGTEIEPNVPYYRVDNDLTTEPNDKGVVIELKYEDGIYTLFTTIGVSVQYGDNPARYYSSFNSGEVSVRLIEDGLVEIVGGECLVVNSSCTVRYKGEDYAVTVYDGENMRCHFMIEEESSEKFNVFGESLIISGTYFDGIIELKEGQSIVLDMSTSSSQCLSKFTANTEGISFHGGYRAVLGTENASVTFEQKAVSADSEILIPATTATVEDINFTGGEGYFYLGGRYGDVSFDADANVTVDGKITLDAGVEGKITATVKDVTYASVTIGKVHIGAGDGPGTVEFSHNGKDYSLTALSGKYATAVLNEESNEFEADINRHSAFISNSKLKYNGKEYDAGTCFVGKYVDSETIVHIDSIGNDHICDVEHEEGVVCGVEVIAHIVDDNGKCDYCGKQFVASVTADGATSYYDDLDSAVAAALTAEAAKITLLADVDYSTKTEGRKYLYIKDKKPAGTDTVLTLDLNGKTLKGEQFGIALDSCVLILEDSDESDEKGVIMNGDLPENPGGAYAGINIVNTCNLTINGGTIIGSSIGVNGGDRVSTTINGGKISGLERGVDAFGGTLTITGGDISSEYTAVNSMADTTTITGGKFSSKGVALYIQLGEVTVTGGEFTGSVYGDEPVKGVFCVGSDASGAVFTDEVNIIPHDNPEIKVTANDLLAEGTSFWTDKDGDGKFETMLAPSDDAMTIEGKIIVRTSCTHPAEKISYDTGICGDCQTQFAASVTADGATTYYADLDSAAVIASEAEESKITLYKDADYSEKTEGRDHFYISGSGKILTIDLNGHEIKGGDYGILIEGGDVIIEDSGDGSGKITSTTEVSGGYGINIRYGTLTVNGGNITGFTGTGIGSQADVAINGGKITGFGYHAVESYGETVITGGTFTGVDTTIRAESGHLTINGGEFYGSPGADNVGLSVGLSDTVVNINGGTFKIDNCAISAPFSLTASAPLSHKITISLDEDGNGPSFPQGICARHTTLGSFLTYGSSFWQGEKMIDLDDTETLLEGNITVKATCLHPDERINQETGICGGCNLQVYVAKVSFNGGEEQLVSDLNSDVFISDRTGKAEVTLISDIVLDGIGLWVDGRYGGISDIVLNLNGHKITGGSVSVFAVMPECSLVINGSGTVIVPDDEDAEPVAVEVTEGATAELNGITIEYADGGKAVSVENGGIFKAKNVVINSASEALCSYGNAEFTDCTLEGTYEAVYIGSGTVTLKDTDVTEISGDGSGNKIAVMVDGGTLNINGGTISGDSAFYVFSDEQAGTTVNLSGCTVYGAVEENGSAKINVGENVKFPEGYQGADSVIAGMINDGYALYDTQTSLPADMGTNPEDIKGNLITKTFDFSHAKIKLASEDAICDGNEHKPALSVLFGGLTLDEELYNVSYEGGFVNVGSYKVVVTPAENSSAVGSVSAYFMILPDSGLIESITKENVTVANEENIKAIIESIENVDLTGVSEETKKELQEIKEKCEELIKEIEEIQKAITNAKEEVADFAETLGYDNYREEQQAEISQIVKDAQDKLDAATTKDEAAKIAEEAKSKLDAVKTDAELTVEEEAKVLEEIKEAAVETVGGYLDTEEYREEQKEQISQIVQAADAAIAGAKSQEEVAAIVTEMKAKLDTVPTKDEMDIIESAMDAITDYVAVEDYRDAEKSRIAQIVIDAQNKLMEAKTPEEIILIVTEAKSKLDALKTDEQLKAEELAKAKEDAAEELGNYVDPEDYEDVLKEEIAKIIADAEADIEKAATVEEVAKIISDAKAEIDLVVADEKYELGDANGDGKVNALDATQILRFANNKSSSLTGEEGSAMFKAADVDGNGKVNALDATQILRYANNKSSVLTK